jgi:hypothetical protein
VTEKAGLLFFAPTQCGAWGDFDNDGLVDLFVGFESSAVAGFDVPLYQEMPVRTNRPAKLFRNNGDGTFTDVAAQAGANITGYLRGAAWGDLDNDGFPELAVARAYGPALLFHNKAGGEGDLKRVLATARELEPAHSSSVTFLDYDQDGWLDLFVAGYSKIASSYASGQVAADLLGQPHTAELSRLYRNDRARGGTDLLLRNVTADAKLDRVYYATGAVAGDLDNDGWPDLYLSTGAMDYRALLPKRLLRNVGGARFEDVSYSAGVAHLQKGSAAALGDVGHDGHLDIFQVLGGEFPGDVFPRAVFINPGNTNHWLEIKLAGTDTNRGALGARIAVQVVTPRGERTLHAFVSGGGSYGGSPLTQHIGLGDATAVRSIEVTWPRSQRTQRFTDVTVDGRYRLMEARTDVAMK